MSDTVYADPTKPDLGTSGPLLFSVTEVRGQQKVLGHAPILAELAARCGQRGAVDHLSFQLSDPYFGSKLPCLFLLHVSDAPSSPVAPSAARSAVPFAAVLLHEYRLLGAQTGIYIPADLAGDWTVLAPRAFRGNVVQAIADHLLRGRARIVLFSSPAQTPEPEGRPSQVTSSQPVAIAERPLLRSLSLRETLDTTLATMGAHTRRNLRLAKRQAATKLGAMFQPQAELSEQEFLAINREGFYPVPDRVARWRYRSALKTPGGFIAAVRTGEGDWVALLGGRHYLATEGLCTAVDWQLNRTSFARYSPGSVMRILLIEHELARGTAQLRFEGGTPHSMRSAFNRERVTDLLYAGAGISPSALRLLGRTLSKGNLLGDFLTSPSLIWRA